VNDLNSALDTLESSRIFRHHFYLDRIHFTDVWPLLLKCRDQAEDGNLEYARRLADLCPPPSKNALEEVQKILKEKWLGNSRWWGWKIVEPEVRFLPTKVERNRMKKQKAMSKKAKEESEERWREKRRQSGRRRIQGKGGEGEKGGERKSVRKPYIRRGE
ncbi:hypothetical protein HK097_003551, partial [Rhizophlyctis rosea]